MKQLSEYLQPVEDIIYMGDSKHNLTLCKYGIFVDDLCIAIPDNWAVDFWKIKIAVDEAFKVENK